MVVVLIAAGTSDRGFDLEKHNSACVWVLRSSLGETLCGHPLLRRCVLCGESPFVCRQLEGILLLDKITGLTRHLCVKTRTYVMLVQRFLPRASEAFGFLCLCMCEGNLTVRDRVITHQGIFDYGSGIY